MTPRDPAGGAPGEGFDRLRVRRPARPVTLVADPGAPPPEERVAGRGTRVLFSSPGMGGDGAVVSPAPAGAAGRTRWGVVPRLVLTCRLCRRTTPLTAMLALRAGTPSVHLPWLALAGVRHTSWMRCPACARRAWVRLSWEL